MEFKNLWINKLQFSQVEIFRKMKKFKFTIQGSEYEVEILDQEGSTAKVEVNGTVYDVEISKEMRTSKTPTLVRSIVKPPEESKAPVSKGVTVVTAPLPGNIIQVVKKVGDKVELGDLVLMYEAMKMENKVLAEVSGTIKSIKVNVGDAVLQGDVLFEIE
jgi:biotin carboxyl carrier protein